MSPWHILPDWHTFYDTKTWPSLASVNTIHQQHTAKQCTIHDMMIHLLRTFAKHLWFSAYNLCCWRIWAQQATLLASRRRCIACLSWPFLPPELLKSMHLVAMELCGIICSPTAYQESFWHSFLQRIITIARNCLPQAKRNPSAQKTRKLWFVNRICKQNWGSLCHTHPSWLPGLCIHITGISKWPFHSLFGRRSTIWVT